jgi:hypothetical protein
VTRGQLTSWAEIYFSVFFISVLGFAPRHKNVLGNTAAGTVKLCAHPRPRAEIKIYRLTFFPMSSWYDAWLSTLPLTVFPCFANLRSFFVPHLN